MAVERDMQGPILFPAGSGRGEPPVIIAVGAPAMPEPDHKGELKFLVYADRKVRKRMHGMPPEEKLIELCVYMAPYPYSAWNDFDFQNRNTKPLSYPIEDK